MAARTATKTGNWSDVTVWDGGASLPQSGDTADSNGYTVTIDQNVTVTTLVNTNAGAGWFVCSTARTINANVTGTVRNVLSTAPGAGVTVTLNGNVTAGASGVNIVNHTGAGTLAITGNATGGSVNLAHAVTQSNGVVTIAGIVTGGSANSARGFSSTGGSASITGSVVGGSNTNGYSASWGSTGTLTVTGSVTAGTVANSTYGIINSSSGTVNITGDCTGTLAAAVLNSSTGTVNITGNVTAGNNNAQAVYGVHNNANGTITVSGSATGGTSTDIRYQNIGAYNASTGTLSVGIAIGGGPYGPGLVGANSGGTTTFSIAKFGANGEPPTYGYAKMAYAATTNYVRVIRSDTGATVDLSNDYPATGDVKLGTVYKLGGATGTMTSGGGHRMFIKTGP